MGRPRVFSDEERKERMVAHQKNYLLENYDKVMERKRVWNREHRAKLREYVTKYNKEHPERCRATRIAGRARKKGILIATTCEKCGANKVEMHHPDYTKPLAVQWLCRVCHKKLHKEQT